MVNVLIFVDKEFILPANYPKGHGNEFKYWLEKYHLGLFLAVFERTSGSRHDLAVEGATTMYWNRKYYIQFPDEMLLAEAKCNISQTNLFIVLSSMEIIAMCRTYAIFHFCISLPMGWLAGNTHTLKDSDWSIFSIGRAINLLEFSLSNIVNDGQQMLSNKFIMGIFEPLLDTFPQFQLYMTFIFEGKETPTIVKNQSNLMEFDNLKKLPYNLLKAELFYPN